MLEGRLLFTLHLRNRARSRGLRSLGYMSDELPTTPAADRTASWLADRGVDTIFCVTGAGNLALVDALSRDGRIRLIFCHHEQAATMAAQGHARVTGKTGVALVTTGGGAANALTGVLSAQLDSIPLLVILGNESSYHCKNMQNFRAYGVQGFDAVSVFRPISKFAERVEDAGHLHSLLCNAWLAAQDDRPGTAVLDFPMDIQRTYVSSADAWAPPGRGFRKSASPLERVVVGEFARNLASAKRPLLYLGNGVRDSASLELARGFIEHHKVPFLLSWSALDLFDDNHPLNVGRAGIYGDRAANIILQKADLLLCLGTRLAIPQVGYDINDFARQADKWVVDIDETELTKFTGSRWHTVHSSAENFLHLLNAEVESPLDSQLETWHTDCQRVWNALPRVKPTVSAEPTTSCVHSVDVMEALNVCLPNDAIIVTDVGAGLLSGHSFLRPRGKQRLFTSQGLGEMGFGLPASIGAHFGAQRRPLICLNTDGGIMFNLQELQTVRTYNIPLKLFVFNNQGYAMIRISQSNLFGSHYVGVDPDSGIGFPDFGQIAETFGLRHFELSHPSRIETTIEESLKFEGASLVEVIMAQDQQYQPRLATKKLADGTLSSPPLEDLDPLIPLHVLSDLLDGHVHPSSQEIRD